MKNFYKKYSAIILAVPLLSLSLTSESYGNPGADSSPEDEHTTIKVTPRMTSLSSSGEESLGETNALPPIKVTPRRQSAIHPESLDVAALTEQANAAASLPPNQAAFALEKLADSLPLTLSLDSLRTKVLALFDLSTQLNSIPVKAEALKTPLEIYEGVSAALPVDLQPKEIVKEALKALSRGLRDTSFTLPPEDARSFLSCALAFRVTAGCDQKSEDSISIRWLRWFLSKKSLSNSLSQTERSKLIDRLRRDESNLAQYHEEWAQHCIRMAQEFGKELRQQLARKQEPSLGKAAFLNVVSHYFGQVVR